MQGFNALFQPGLRPRRHLDAERRREARWSSEGTSRQELGREAFEERVWEWLHEYGGKILASSAASARRSTTAARASRWTTRTSAR